MTGLDQDMMQKNLSCKSLKESQKNMYCYGITFVPVNMLFLVLGILLMTAATQMNIEIPVKGDDLLPMFAAEGYLGYTVLVLFTIGIIAAAFSSADSALAALTTSFCIDILNAEKYPKEQAESIRRKTHIFISAIFVLCILAFEIIDSPSVIDTIYVLASYTYGPLLGLFIFGLFTKMQPRDKYVPIVALLSPVICIIIDKITFAYTGYTFGYELLMLNGLLTFTGLTLLSSGRPQVKFGI